MPSKIVNWQVVNYYLAQPDQCLSRQLGQSLQQILTPNPHQVTMSYLEIYNENIRDLLDPSSGYLDLRDESGGKNIQVKKQKIYVILMID